MTAPILLMQPLALTTAAPAAAETHRLNLVDRLFRRGLEAVNLLAGIRVGRCRSAEDEMEAEAVVQAVMGDRRANIPRSVRHIERRYARMAVTFVARHRGRPVGTLTLYAPTTHSRTVQSAALELPEGVRPWQVLDIGRLAVLPEYRGGARLALLGLLAAAQRFSERAGRTYWVGMTSPGLVRAFRALNPTLRLLEPAAEDRRSPLLVRYWVAYRAGSNTTLVPFILASAGASPYRLLSRHAARLVRARLTRPFMDGYSGSRG